MQSSKDFLAVVLRGLLAVSMLQFAAMPPLARETTFNPRIAAVWTYNDNVGFVEGDDKNSDTSAGIHVTLPVERQLQQGALLFQYDVSSKAYREFSSLDHLDHQLRFDYGVRRSRFSSLNLSAGYYFTQDQANPGILENSVDPDPFLSARTEREAYNLGVGYQRDINKWWAWSGSVSTWQTDFSRIDGFDPGGIPEPGPQDKTGYGGTTGFKRKVSGSSSVGAEYTYGLTDLEQEGQVNTHRLNFTFSTRVSRRISLGGKVGGYRSTHDTLREDKSGAEGTLSINFNDDLTAGPVRFRFGAGVLPSYGGAQEGTSTNTGVFASVSGVRDRRVNWGIEARYSQRRPQFFSQSKLDSTSVSARMEVAILQNLGFRLRVRRTDQTAPNQPSRSFFTFSVGPTWYPLGRTRIAGR